MEHRERKSSLPTQSRIRLGVCIDDFGLYAGINAATLRLLDMQRVSAISCLVEGEAWKTGAAALHGVDADIGLHLNLTEPCKQSVVSDTLPRLITRAYLRRLDTARVQAAIERQLDGFELALGRPPDFVDGHQHVHQLPIVREQLLRVLTQRYVSRPWIRYTASRLRVSPWHWSNSAFKAWTIAGLGSHSLARQAHALGFPMNRRFLGVYGFQGGTAGFASHVSQWLDAAQDGDLLMCHPSLGVEAGDPIRDARPFEFSVLSSPAFAAHLAQRQIEVVRLSALLSSGDDLQAEGSVWAA